MLMRESCSRLCGGGRRREEVGKHLIHSGRVRCTSGLGGESMDGSRDVIIEVREHVISGKCVQIEQ